MSSSKLIEDELYGEEREKFLKELKVGDLVDAIRDEKESYKICWSRAKVTELNGDTVKGLFLDDPEEKSFSFPRRSRELAPYGSKRAKYEWR